MSCARARRSGPPQPPFARGGGGERAERPWLPPLAKGRLGGAVLSFSRVSNPSVNRSRTASEGVAADHLAIVPGPQRPPSEPVDRVLDVLDAAVGHQGIDATGVVAIRLAEVRHPPRGDPAAVGPLVLDRVGCCD